MKQVYAKYTIDNINKMTGVELFRFGVQLQEDIKSFQHYRERAVLGLMLLHTRRRQRLLLYFAFQKYKTQVYKTLVSEYVEMQDMAIPTRGLPAPEERRASSPGPPGTLTLQDQMLEEVFRIPQQEQDSSGFLGTPSERQKSVRPFQSQLRNEKKIKYRKQCAVVVQAMAQCKSRASHWKTVSFFRWRLAVCEQRGAEADQEIEALTAELRSTKDEQEYMLRTFSQSKSEMEIKLRKLASIVQEKILRSEC